jgi:hypothetical protein
MKQLALKLLGVILIVIIDGCGSGGESTWSISDFKWGKNLDFYEITLDNLSETEEEWKIIVNDEDMQINGYLEEYNNVDYIGNNWNQYFSNFPDRYTAVVDESNTMIVTTDYDDFNVIQVFELTPTTKSSGQYLFKNYTDGLLTTEKEGSYTIDVDGSQSYQYEQKYSNDDGSTDGIIPQNCTPYSIIYENPEQTWSSDRISTANRLCSEACDAKSVNNNTEIEERCGDLHYMLDYVDSYNTDHATTCPVCN